MFYYNEKTIKPIKSNLGAIKKETMAIHRTNNNIIGIRYFHILGISYKVTCAIKFLDGM